MFQTEIVIFLQSLSTDFLTLFFTFFTEIGRSTYSIPLVFLVLFAVNFRAGCILVHAVAWNGLITMSLKEYFALPRPHHVDLNVKLLGEGGINPTHFESRGARSFFQYLPNQVIAYFRAHPLDSWGFPSGHASQAMTLWGTLFMIFKRRWVRLTALLMVICIPLSRMYLGKHFLADILAGMLLGLLMVAVFFCFLYRNENIRFFLFPRSREISFKLKSVILLVYLLIVPFLILSFFQVSHDKVAAILGFNIGFLIIRSRGIPLDSGSILQRAGRLLIAGLMFFLVHTLMERGAGLFFASMPISVEFVQQALTYLLFFWGAVEVNLKLGLYQR